MSVVNHSHVVDVAVVVEHKVRECSEDSLFWLDVDRRLPPRGASREQTWPIHLIFVNSCNDESQLHGRNGCELGAYREFKTLHGKMCVPLCVHFGLLANRQRKRKYSFSIFMSSSSDICAYIITNCWQLARNREKQ